MKNSAKKICCFGEVLLRMSPPAGWTEDHVLHSYIGGAEGNVAAALARWQLPVKYCTALPDHFIGHDIEQYLRQRGIDTSAIAWQGDRVGLYYMQQGADLKHAGVVYDRYGSSFYQLRPGDIPWHEVLEEASWLHITAISPALGPQAADVCLEAVQAAKAKGLQVSVDLNYRAKLWQYGKEPVEVMPQLVGYCDVVMGNIWSAGRMLGTRIDAGLDASTGRERYLEHAAATAQEIQAMFPSCKTVAFSFRFDEGNSGVRYYGTLYEQEQLFVSDTHTAEQITDKAGSGDCFMAGIIYGKQQKLSPQETIRFAASAAFGKLQEKGDATRQSVAMINSRIHRHV